MATHAFVCESAQGRLTPTSNRLRVEPQTNLRRLKSYHDTAMKCGRIIYVFKYLDPFHVLPNAGAWRTTRVFTASLQRENFRPAPKNNVRPIYVGVPRQNERHR